uniref:Small ORF n=1 Tax=Avian infectious bursal disease virus TaxID=10995 RepID=Q82625_IBDV|nr:unnamed protein product [Infectious bursal disease virus]
MELLLLQRYH